MVRNKEQHDRAVALRKSGKTYGDICAILGNIPKGTLHYWLRDTLLSENAKKKLDKRIEKKLVLARQNGQRILKERRERYFSDLKNTAQPLLQHLSIREISLLVLATLYLGEGRKRSASSLMFGNSDPDVVALFLHLLRFCYTVDESKFRCTIQGRADQKIEKLERFWSRVTGISRSQFYAFRVDPRSRGKRTIKTGYKGVCRIDYFSSKVFDELMVIGELLKRGR